MLGKASNALPFEATDGANRLKERDIWRQPQPLQGNCCHPLPYLGKGNFWPDWRVAGQAFLSERESVYPKAFSNCSYFQRMVSIVVVHRNVVEPLAVDINLSCL